VYIYIYIPPVVGIVGMTRLLSPMASEACELLLGERVPHLRPERNRFPCQSTRSTNVEDPVVFRMESDYVESDYVE
jgi:hypothetical protein